MSETSGKRIAKNTGLMFGGKGGGAILNMLVLVVVGRALGLEIAGSLFIIHAAMLTAAELGGFKSWQALIKFGVPHVQNGDKQALQKLLRFSIGLDLVSACVAFVAVELFLWIAAGAIGLAPEYKLIAMAYCMVILLRQSSASIGVLRLIDRFDLLAFHAVIMPFTRLVGSLIAWAFDGGLAAFVTVWFVSAIANYIVLWFFAGRELHRAGLWKGMFSKLPTLRAPEAGLWKFSWTANIDSSIAVAKQELPVLLAGGILGASFAAVFKVAVQIASVLVKGTQQLDEVIYPELAQMINRGEANKIWPLLIRSGAILVGIAIAAGTVVGLLGPDLLSYILQKDYGPSAPLATLLLVAGAISAAYAPLLPTLYAVGRPGQAVIARATGVGTLLILFVVLARLLGPMGPGWAFVIGDTFALVIAVMLTRRALARQIARDKTETTPRQET